MESVREATIEQHNQVGEESDNEDDSETNENDNEADIIVLVSKNNF